MKIEIISTAALAAVDDKNDKPAAPAGLRHIYALEQLAGRFIVLESNLCSRLINRNLEPVRAL